MRTVVGQYHSLSLKQPLNWFYKGLLEKVKNWDVATRVTFAGVHSLALQNG